MEYHHLFVATKEVFQLPMPACFEKKDDMRRDFYVSLNKFDEKG